MPSSKGNPTDPELREQVKEEVKAEEKGEPYFIYLFCSQKYYLWRLAAYMFRISHIYHEVFAPTTLSPPTLCSSPQETKRQLPPGISYTRTMGFL